MRTGSAKCKALLTTLAVLTACFIATRLLLRDRPTKILEYKFAAPLGPLANGFLVWAEGPHMNGPAATPDNPTVRILAQPLDGGASRQVAADAPGYKLYLNQGADAATGLSTWRDDIYYGLALPAPRPPQTFTGPRRATARVSGRPVTAASLQSKLFIGEYAAPVPSAGQASHAGVDRWTSEISAERTTIRIRKVPLRGGPAVDVRAITGSNLVLVGKNAFWDRSRGGVFTSASTRSEYWSERHDLDDLMWADLASGKEHVVTSRTSAVGPPAVGADGVMWAAPRPFPDPALDLYYARAVDGSYAHLGQRSRDESIDWSVEWQGAVYWFTRPRSGKGRPNVPYRFMSAALDGTGKCSTIDANMVDRVPIPGRNMFVWKGAIYCLLADNRNSYRRSVWVVRLDPHSNSRYVNIQSVPQVSTILGCDAGSLYYISAETRRGWIERLTDDDAGERQVDVLLRLRLP